MPRNFKLIFTDRVAISDHECLRIEAPGCVVKVHAGLTNHDKQQVTRVDIRADGNNYLNDEQWWCPDLVNPKGIGVRVVQMDSKPEFNLDGAVFSQMETVLSAYAKEAGWNKESVLTLLLRYISELVQLMKMENPEEHFRIFLEQQLEAEDKMSLDEQKH